MFPSDSQKMLLQQRWESVRKMGKSNPSEILILEELLTRAENDPLDITITDKAPF